MNNKTTEHPLAKPESRFLAFFYEYRWHALLIASAYFLLCLSTWFAFLQSTGFRQLSLMDFEIGRVAERDVVANREISYVDEASTKLRRDARQKLVTAVFRYDRLTSASMLSEFSSFIDRAQEMLRNAASSERFVLEMQQQYPGYFDLKVMQTLFALKDRSTALQSAKNLFTQLVSEGIAEFPDAGMDQFNKTNVEVVTWRNDRQERNEMPIGDVLLIADVRSRIADYLTLQKRAPISADTMTGIVLPFIRVNLMYQAEESEAKLENALKQVQPVLVVIQKGQKIVKRGFIVTEEQYTQLKALSESGVHVDARQFLGSILFLALVIVMAVFLLLPKLSGITLGFRNACVITVAFSVLYILSLIASRARATSDPYYLAVLLPASLLTMLITVLVHQRVAALSSFVLTLGVLCATSFAVVPSLFTLFSALAGVAVMRITGKRIDLVKSASFLALINPLILLVMYLLAPTPTVELSRSLALASVNGFMGGILALGFLPILESLLNTSTSFRLMEFSDLNSPLMKKMLLSVSGTYNHSIMVATLAESACREIGADPLIARVGAYYHDIGKMDQGEYFVENQTDYNKHLDINPRLSATVIRSHVKQGLEKARQMRLPKEVMEIIAEHHGNSLISYFYNEAKKREESVDPEDFTYPGNPPTSRESAVVMLADVVEAACRTLDKPSVPRLEKFIGELVTHKIETHQLDNSDLTFREIGIIKRTFVNILAGYYHSRIEYPNQKDPDSGDQSPRESVLKGKKHE